LEIMLSEISQAQKDKYQMISFICGVFLKRWFHRNESKIEDTRSRGEQRGEVTGKG
jgi:hypothetical protein